MGGSVIYFFALKQNFNLLYIIWKGVNYSNSDSPIYFQAFASPQINFCNCSIQIRAVQICVRLKVNDFLYCEWLKKICLTSRVILWQISKKISAMAAFFTKHIFSEWQRQCLRHPCHYQRFQPQQSLDGTDQGKWLGNFGKHLLENYWEILVNIYWKMIGKFW